jgi:hypothetical protein
MKISGSATYALGVLAAVAILAGCSSSGAGSQYSPVSPMAAGPGMTGMGHTAHVLDRHNTMTSVKTVKVHPDHHKSWVSPDAAKAPRLYFASDSGTNDVYILTMPGLALKGTLTGFSEPQGECSDKNGNIWVTNTGTSQIYLLSRTGSTIGTLSDPDGYPVGCAVNPTNGDLAVTDIFDFSEAGGVLIYHNGSGSPTRISNPAQYEYYFVGYDSSGNLFTDGWSYPSFTFTISTIPAGSSTASTVSISGGTPTFPGMVQWYRAGNYLAVGDQECGGQAASCIFWYSISGSTATYTGQTDLSTSGGGAVTDLVQGVIAANNEKYLAGGDAGAATANRWMWDAGGAPTNSVGGLSLPIGAAISTK